MVFFRLLSPKHDLIDGRRQRATIREQASDGRSSVARARHASALPRYALCIIYLSMDGSRPKVEWEMKHVRISTVVQSTRPGLRQIRDRWPLSQANPRRRARGTPILRFPAAYTSVSNLEECRDLLLARKAELSSSVRSKPDALAEIGHVSEEDQSPVIHGEYIAVRINQMSHEQLNLVEAALARLDSGEYGICVECERPITAKRLAAIPWASHCVACQEQLDLMREFSERVQT